MDESGPKNKKPLTEQEAGVQLVDEIFFEYCHSIFTELEVINPTRAAGLKSDFEEYMRILAEIMKNDPQGNLSAFKEIQQRIPNNGWTQFMNYMKDAMLATPRKESLDIESEDFANDVEKRMKGEDIN